MDGEADCNKAHREIVRPLFRVGGVFCLLENLADLLQQVVCSDSLFSIPRNCDQDAVGQMIERGRLHGLAHETGGAPDARLLWRKRQPLTQMTPRVKLSSKSVRLLEVVQPSPVMLLCSSRPSAWPLRNSAAGRD